MKRNHIVWLIGGAFLVTLFVAWYVFDLSHFFSFDYIQKNSAALLSFVQENYLLSVFLYISLFITTISFSLPATGPLTLLGGFLFGIVGGFFLAIVSATIGATIAFLLIKSQVTDILRKRYGKQLKTFQTKTEKYGVVYILLMHFSMMVPYLIINILTALADIKPWTIIWTSAIGFIPLALIYTFAGSRLTTITSVNDVFSYNMMIVIGIFVLLFFLPLVIRRLKGGHLI